ncbi:MAG: hypothetical protein CBR30_00635 [Dictyoglomus sp. NZ13-RE01]|nr:MAG: hypothetical protein CBR30_00635 [Dictyoglomus sp. NZ13-RE01]
MDQKILGMILLLIGIFLTLINFHLLSGSSIIFIFAISFLYMYKRFGKNIGFLIPGCILTAVGIYLLLRDLVYVEGIYFLPLLGLSFIAIYFVHTSKFSKYSGERYWPLYPGIILTTIGLILIFQEKLSNYINLLIPITLIIIGISLLIKRR